MKINKQILDTLKQCGLPEGDVIPILIAYYLGHDLPSYLPENVAIAINKTGIVEQNGDTKELIWKVPLIEGHDPRWEWVHKENQILIEPYKYHNKWKGECIKRMKRLFAANPDLRKKNVLLATKSYIETSLRTGTQAIHIKRPHNFLWKGQGVNLENEVLGYLVEV